MAHATVPKYREAEKLIYHARRARLCVCLFYTIQMMEVIAANAYTDHNDFRRSHLGHNFGLTQLSCSNDGDSGTLVNAFKTWLRAHEEAQVMFASVLVVVGLWWLVRTVLTLFINLICPLLVVLLAVVCVPQLRAPLLGQNYPLLANLLKNILIKMADNIRA